MSKASLATMYLASAAKQLSDSARTYNLPNAFVLSFATRNYTSHRASWQSSVSRREIRAYMHLSAISEYGQKMTMASAKKRKRWNQSHFPECTAIESSGGESPLRRFPRRSPPRIPQVCRHSIGGTIVSLLLQLLY